MNKSWPATKSAEQLMTVQRQQLRMILIAALVRAELGSGNAECDVESLIAAE